MTAITQERPTINPPSLLRASGTIVWRNLIHIKRMPEMLLDVTVQSVMFVLLFAYVFGGAIETPGFDYVDFLMPGIIVQSMVFGGFVTALGLAEDLKKGLITDTLDLWILSRLHQCIKKATQEFDKFEYCDARVAIEDFFWNDLWLNVSSRFQMASFSSRSVKNCWSRSAARMAVERFPTVPSIVALSLGLRTRVGMTAVP